MIRLRLFARGRSSATRRRAGLKLLVGSAAVSLIAASSAFAHPATSDPAHGGSAVGVKVVGHSDLGLAGVAQGLNAHVAVLGDHAFVGFGTNGGFAAQWNKTPTCQQDEVGTDAGNSVKVVSLADPANPTVVARIPVGSRSTIARDVSAIRVQNLSPANSAFTGDLLAVALESCGNSLTGEVGVLFFDVTIPSAPVLLGNDNRFLGNVATRAVHLVQQAGGRVLAFEANQGSRGGIQVMDVTNPRQPSQIADFPQAGKPVFSFNECRPFNFAQGVETNAAGTKAYAAYSDLGLFTFDTASPSGTLSPTGSMDYPDSEEGNSFRFIPNSTETVAVATDEDLNPAKTTLTVTNGTASTFTEPGGSAPGVFRGCEAIWGGPLYERPTSSLDDKEIVSIQNGGCSELDYAGRDVSGKIVLTARGGGLPGSPCSFDTRTQMAQSFGAVAMVVSNTTTDHHGSGAGVLFSPDSTEARDAGVEIPLVMIALEAGDAIRGQISAGVTPIATLADSADTWGALRVIDVSATNPTQLATFTAPHTTTLTPGDGLYHAVNATWDGSNALVAWMSDGLRVVDLSSPSAPKARAFFVPPVASDPTGNYGAVPLVVDVAKVSANRFVVIDINGGLYVADVVLHKDDCKNGGWQRFGFADQGTCVTLFDDTSV